MSQNMVNSPSSPIVPDRLVALVTRLKGTLDQISAVEEAVKAAGREAVVLAMAAGDDLQTFKDEVGHGHFREKLELYTNRKPSSVADYIRLAKNRTKIEAHMAQMCSAAHFSIRDALALLRDPSKSKKKPAVGWDALSDKAKQAGLKSDGLDAFLGYLPPDWREGLADQVARVDAKQETVVDRHLTALVRNHLKTLVANDPTNPVVGFIAKYGIDLLRVTVCVGADDGPAKRRPPLITRTNSNVIAFSASPSTPPP